MSSQIVCSKPLGEGGNGNLRSLKYPVALFLIVLAVSVTAFAVLDCSDEADAASSGDDGDIHWQISEDKQTHSNKLTLSKKSLQPSGDMKNYSQDSRPLWEEGTGWSSVTMVGIQGDVTSIGDYAFYKCTSIASVTIPNSVTSIGSSAFSGCTSLASVTIPNSVTSIGSSAFRGCTSFTSVTIPNSVTSIGSSAFRDCTSLASVDLGSVTSIGDWAFSGCTSLASVTIPNSVTSIGSYAFRGCTSLAPVDLGSVTSIGRSAFYGCTKLSSVTIPNSVTSIGNYAFENCTSLASVDLGSVTSIVYGMFQGCTSLTSVTIPDSATSIGNYAFENCTSLASVTIGKSVTSIGNYVFQNCTSLASVTIGKSVTSIGTEAFQDCYKLFEVINLSSLKITKGDSYYGYVAYYAMNVFTSVEEATVGTTDDGFVYGNSEGTWYLLEYIGSDTAVVLPDKLESHYYEIYKYAFQNCTFLTSVTIGKSVTSIGSYAFNGCTSLTSVTFGNSVMSIGSYAFNGCTSLASVTTGNSVESIGSYAFNDCTSLTSVTIGNYVTSIGSYAFNDCTSLTSVTIPDSVMSIEGYAFQHCTSLESLTIPISLDQVGSTTYPSGPVFEDCTDIRTVTFTQGIGAGCDYSSKYQYTPWYLSREKCTEIFLSDGIKSLGGSAFKGCSLTSVTIPDSIMFIGDSAFDGCTSLTSVTIPDSVRSIGGSAFQSHTFYDTDGTTVLPKTAASLRGYLYIGESADKMIRQVRMCTVDVPKKSELTPATYIWLNYDYTVIKTAQDVPWGQDPAHPESPVHPDGLKFYGWNEESAPGYKVFLAKFQGERQLPPPTQKEGQADKVCYIWINHDATVLQVDPSVSSSSLPPYSAPFPTHGDGLTFSGWKETKLFSYTVMEALFTEGELENLGGDSGDDGAATAEFPLAAVAAIVCILAQVTLASFRGRTRRDRSRPYRNIRPPSRRPIPLSSAPPGARARILVTDRIHPRRQVRMQLNGRINGLMARGTAAKKYSPSRMANGGPGAEGSRNAPSPTSNA